MARYLGFDGFRGGWVMAWIEDDGRHGFTYSNRIADLLTGPFKRAMIDIPIGLPDTGYRRCDQDARKMAGASVFLGARRGLLKFETFGLANKFYWSKGEPGISLQLWNIRDKIADVERLMTPGRQRRIGEAHPELLFQSRARGHRLAGKKSAKGRAQRVKSLKRLGFTCIEMMLGQRAGTGIRRDDLIDACACAVVARDINAKRILGGGECDGRGLAMKIHY